MKIIARKLLFIALIASIILPATAQRKTKSLVTTFPKIKNWDEALLTAKQQNKWIFVDCYTDWCGWCDIMDKKNFSSEEVQKPMNSFMNCYSLEMEKDSIGQLLRFQYSVNVFPTFLIFASDGTLVSQILGYSERKEWLHTIDSFSRIFQKTGGVAPIARPGFPALSIANIPSWWMQQHYKRDFKIFDDTTKTGFAAQFNNLTKPYDIFVLGGLGSYQLSDKNIENWLNMTDTFSQLFGRDLTQTQAINILHSRLYKANNQKDEVAYKHYFPLAVKWSLYPDWESASLQQDWFRTIKDYSSLMTSVESQMSKMYHSGLNENAWFFFENTDDPALLKRALALSSKSIELKEDWQYYDTRANIEFKLKMYAECKADAEKAIALGKAQGDDVSPTEQVLKKLPKVKK